MNNTYDKEDLYKSLNNINMWINNADIKASIVLSFIGIIITVIFSNDRLTMKFIKISNVLSSSNCLLKFLTLISMFLFVISLYKLLLVLRPDLIFTKLVTKRNKKNEQSSKSVIFFGDISQRDSFKNFYSEIKNKNEEEIFRDIANQVYVNSKICSKKFKNLKEGQFSLAVVIILTGILFIFV